MVSFSEEAREFGRGLHDLLVVGAGGLGLRVAQQWRERHPDALVACATWSNARHGTLRREGFIPILSSELVSTSASYRAPYVIFCAPPSRRQDIADYCRNIREAGVLAARSFLFTSATSVYEDTAEYTITEDSPLAKHPRALRMRTAEYFARMSGGEKTRVLRLGLLYDRNKGCHQYYFAAPPGTPVFDAPGSVYNSVHYDDAASCAIATLEFNTYGANDGSSTFIAVDGKPITSSEMVAAVRNHPTFERFPTPIWGRHTNTKIVDNTRTRTALNWTPKWNSFQEFFAADAAAMRAEEKLGLDDEGIVLAPLE